MGVAKVADDQRRPMPALVRAVRIRVALVAAAERKGRHRERARGDRQQHTDEPAGVAHGRTPHGLLLMVA